MITSTLKIQVISLSLSVFTPFLADVYDYYPHRDLRIDHFSFFGFCLSARISIM